MLKSRRRRLCKIKDCHGHVWDVFESRPTEHGWPLLLGSPSLATSVYIPLERVGVQVIPTQELKDYLEEYRMNLSALRLPIANTTICRVRDELGMNYIRDRKNWWAQVRQELLHPDAPVPHFALDTDRLTPFKTYPKSELRRIVELAKEGKTMKEIARILHRVERTVDNFHRQLFGVTKPQHAWSEQEKERLLQLRRQGCATAAIASTMGRQKKSVQHKISKLDPPSGQRSQRWTEAEKQRLKKLALKGYSIEKLMQAMDRSYTSIVFTCRKILGLKYSRKRSSYISKE